MKILAALSLAMVSLSATATPTIEAQLKYEYFDKGVSICSGEKRVTYGDKFLVCDRMVNGKRYLLKTYIKQGTGDGMVTAEVDTIDANGKMARSSEPTISFIYGEQASMTIGDSNGEMIRFQAVVTRLDLK